MTFGNTGGMVRAEAIRELRAAGLDVAAADESFDRFARLVHRHLGVPTAMVTLILEDRQVFPGAHGLPAHTQASRQGSLEESFCKHVVEEGSPLIIPDARTLDEFRESPAVLDGWLIAYAGFPIFDPAGRPVGSLCAIDNQTHVWSEAECATLTDLAAACSSELRLRVSRNNADRMHRSAAQATRRTRLLLELSEAFAGATSVTDIVETLWEVGTMINAEWAGLALPDATGRILRYTTLDHLEVGLTPEFRRASIDDDRATSAVARSRRPLFFRNDAELIEAFPITADAIGPMGGGRAFLPVMVGTRLLGVMMLGWTEERDFDAEAIKTEEAIASYLSHALERAQLLEERNNAAATLQEAMLSPLPKIRHLDLSFLYSPAARTDQVGGDWYDAVALDNDTAVLMIGDVTGHDMHAAAQMGQLRSMLRTFVWSQDESPSTLLQLLDLANRGLDLHATGTAIVARLERRLDPIQGVIHHVTWSNAGHPPPFVLRADGSVEQCAGDPDIMLGVIPGHSRHDHHTTLAPGDTLLLYTDGLIEVRGMRYLDRLAELKVALKDLVGTATSALPAALVRRLVVHGQQDDVAVLAIRIRHHAHGQGAEHPTVAHLRVDHEASAIGPARRWVDDILEGEGLPEDVRRTTMLLTSETVTNAIRHAAPPVELSVSVNPRLVRVSVRDGSPVVPRLMNPSPHEPGGRGVQFLERRSSRWGVATYDGGPGDSDDVRSGGSGGDRPRPARPGKTVWFEVDRPGNPATSTGKH